MEFKYGAELAVLFPSFLPVTSAHLFHFPSVFFQGTSSYLEEYNSHSIVTPVSALVKLI